MMKKIHLLTTFLILLVLISASFAQPYQEALARLDKRLKFAQDLLQTFPDNRARDLLKRAVQQRNRAAIAISARRYREAQQCVIRANKFLDAALKIILAGPLNRQKERLDALIRQAENVVAGNRRAEELLRKAKHNRLLAIKNFQEKRFDKAMEFYRIAIFLAERSIELVEGRSKTIEEQYTKEEERFKELLERARTLVQEAGTRESQRLIHQAMEQAQRSRQAALRGELRLALEFYHRATRLLIRAIDLAEGRPMGTRRKVEEEMELLRDLTLSVRDRIESSENPRAKLLLEKAMRFERKARGAFDKGRYKEALHQTRIAKDLIRQAVKLMEMERAPLKGRVEEELVKLKDEIYDLSSEGSRDPEVKEILTQAETCLKDAEIALRQEKPRLALERIWIASRLFSKATDLLEGREPRLSAERVKESIVRLNKAIVEIRPRIEKSKNDLARELFSYALEMKINAERSLKKRYINLATEQIKVAEKILIKSIKLIEPGL